MKYGIMSGLLWGLDTTILSIALAMSPFFLTEQAIFLAPFISTFLHDMFSSIWMALYLAVNGKLKACFKKIKTRSGKFIVLAALLGGPLGMTGYVLAIKYIGPSYTAIISSLYPAVGALLAYIFLKEKMKPISIVGLLISLFGIIALGYIPGGQGENFLLGFGFALLCVVGWASEAVVCSYGMKDEEVTPEESLQIRQITSAIAYIVIIIPILSGLTTTFQISLSSATPVIIITALFGTVSYVYYYKAIHSIGATKAMSLNITYSAWAIVFGFLLLGQPLSLKSILCSVIIMIGSIMAAGDIKELLSSNYNQTEVEFK